MTTRQLTVNCPSWSSDGPASREGSFRKSCENAYRAVEATALNKIADAQDCQDWHYTMFSSHVPLDYYAGNFRQVDASRPCLQVNVEVEGVAGESPECVPLEVNNVFDLLRRNLASLERLWPQLTAAERARRLAIVLGTVIGRFIQIHPFINGNGRTSRLLWAWGLMRFGIPPQIRIRQHPENPKYDFVMAKAMQGDFDHLSLFILGHLTMNAPGMPPPPKS